MSTIPSRDKLNVEDTWDLTPIFANDDAWEGEFNATADALGPIVELRGTLADSAENLAAVFSRNYALIQRLDGLYTYAHLKADEDTANTHYMAMQERIRGRWAEVAAATSWIDPEILAIPEDTLAQYRQDPAVQPFDRPLEVLLRDRPHTLSNEQEELLAQASETLSAPSTTFTLLNNADLKFPDVNMPDGSITPLTHGTFIRLLESPDRDLRKQTFEKFYDTVAGLRNTFASTLAGHVKTRRFSSKARKFDSAFDAAMHYEGVDACVYDSLVSAVNEALPTFHRLHELRRDVLGLDAVDAHDVYVPLVEDEGSEISFDTAVEWILESVAPLGADYQNVVRKAFSERWTDVYECQGKRAGAYCATAYDAHPYMLMNYKGNLNNVFTLTHELGHAMHSWYSCKHQPYWTHGYKIFVAEVASTTNEALLTRWLLDNEPVPGMRAAVLNNLCMEFRGTMFRQTQFAEFEKTFHDASAAGTPLTPDYLFDLYYGLNERYYGPAVQADKRIGWEWARIPHFYTSFYVYKYATGFAAAQAFAKIILEGGQAELDGYHGFLRAGGSKDPLDILGDAGVDLRDPQVITNTIAAFDNAITELTTELGK
jgi:oligoendopeptidase F